MSEDAEVNKRVVSVNIRVPEDGEGEHGEMEEGAGKSTLSMKSSARLRKEKKKQMKMKKHIVPIYSFQFVQLWWQKAPIKYAFSHPYIRSRLEKLMGSNMVSLTDRAYMQRLQERILEDYALAMEKRIIVREAEEMERVKNLVLIGKIPMDQAPPEMADHPVMLIEQYCNKLIAERRAKMKVLKVHIPRYLYYDDTPDPPSGLSIEKGHVFREPGERLCTPPEHYVFIPDEEDVENGYMFTAEAYDYLKYEDPLIKQLKACETIEEMYARADEILGVLKSLLTDTRKKAPEKKEEGAD